MATPQGSEEIVKALQTAHDYVPDIIERAIMWLASLGAVLGIGRGIAIKTSKDYSALKADQAVRDQMDVMAETIKDQHERLHNMGLKIGALRDIELDGAADVDRRAHV